VVLCDKFYLYGFVWVSVSSIEGGETETGIARSRRGSVSFLFGVVSFILVITLRNFLFFINCLRELWFWLSDFEISFALGSVVVHCFGSS